MHFLQYTVQFILYTWKKTNDIIKLRISHKLPEESKIPVKKGEAL